MILFGKAESKAPIAVNFNYAAINWEPYGSIRANTQGATPLVCLFGLTCAASSSTRFIYPVGSTVPVLLSLPSDIVLRLGSLTGASDELYRLLLTALKSFVNINVNPLPKKSSDAKCLSSANSFTYPLKLQQCHLMSFDYTLGGSQGSRVITLDTPIKLVCAKVFYRAQQISAKN